MSQGFSTDKLLHGGDYNPEQWLEEIVDELYRNGISTILATPSGARPKWLADKYDRCYLGPAPGGLTDVLGLRFAEIDGLYENGRNQLNPVLHSHSENEVRGEGGQEQQGTLGCSMFRRSYRCHSLCELVRTTTAGPLMVYGEDFNAGDPAFTCNTYG